MQYEMLRCDYRPVAPWVIDTKSRIKFDCTHLFPVFIVQTDPLIRFQVK